MESFQAEYKACITSPFWVFYSFLHSVEKKPTSGVGRKACVTHSLLYSSQSVTDGGRDAAQVSNDTWSCSPTSDKVRIVLLHKGTSLQAKIPSFVDISLSASLGG